MFISKLGNDRGIELFLLLACKCLHVPAHVLLQGACLAYRTLGSTAATLV